MKTWQRKDDRLDLERAVVHWNTDVDIHRLPNEALRVWMAAVNSLHEGDQRIASAQQLAMRSECSQRTIEVGMRYLEEAGLVVRDTGNARMIPPEFAFVGPANAIWPPVDHRGA